MRFVDPLSLKLSQPKDVVLFAASQLQGGEPRQEDYFVNFNEECIVVADGGGGLPHGDVAATLAGETAIWGYKHIRQHRFYWLDKKLFMKRIFRSANLAVWQKHREVDFTDGLATTLLVLMVGTRAFWIGSAGDTQAFLWREGKLTKLTHEDVDSHGKLVKALGFTRLGLVPEFVTEEFRMNDTILVCTAGVGNYLLEKDMVRALAAVGSTTDTMSAATTELLRCAQSNGSQQNMTVCMVRRAPRR